MESTRLCSVENCERPYCAKGYCSTHWSQANYRGFTTPIGWVPPRDPCLFPECNRNRFGHGLCSGHYQQQRKGKPLTPLRLVDIDDRLNACIEKTPGCWIWTGNANVGGYGLFSIRNRLVPAHRLMYEKAYGPIPKGLVVDHKCHTPACVNPEHLHAVTVKQNGENRSGPNASSTSGVLGVSWDKQRKKWRARATSGGREYHVGYFDSLEVAEAEVIKMRNKIFTNNLVDRR